MTGIFTFIPKDNGKFTMNGQLNHLPSRNELEFKLMEFGDLRSLAVEYPDYNSLGNVMLTIDKVRTTMSNKPTKYSYTKSLPSSIPNFSDLAGRALIITMRNDLIAYGIIANESDS